MFTASSIEAAPAVGVQAATAVVVDDGSATVAAVRGNNGAAVGPMHVMRCMCTGGPYGPYLESVQTTWHGL